MKKIIITSLALIAIANSGCSNEPKVANDISGLMQDLKTGDDATRAAAALALGEKGAEARDAVPALTEALRDEYELVRERAAEALGQIGPPAKAAVPALSMALKDAVADVREAAADALQRIGPRDSTKTGRR
jgi:HEAT repeat protein